MHFFLPTAVTLLGTSTFVSAAATGFTARDLLRRHVAGQLPDGLPNPSPDQLKNIELNAHGTLPNTPPPPTISRGGITSLQLIAFNELFETVYFNEMLCNVTNNVEGYQISDPTEREFVIKALTAIKAQEELHLLSANTALQHFNAEPIQACTYRFPVTDFKSAIVLASTFTDLVLGTLQDAVEIFAVGGDSGLARLIASVIGQEGEQQGWYRVLQGKIPSELPFLTTSDLSFAFTAIQSFTVPGSCPNQHVIELQTFQPLTILTPPGPRTQEITVSWTVTEGHNEKRGGDHGLYMTYINQQNLPIVEELRILSRNGNTVTAEALFPFDANELNGFTIAAVTNSKGPFANANAVAKSTVFGPGLIIVN